MIVKNGTAKILQLIFFEKKLFLFNILFVNTNNEQIANSAKM